MQKELIHTGSVKNVFKLDNGKIEFEFSDRISVFDKIIPSTIPGKGESLNDMACHWFDVLSAAGVHNHFIKRTGPTSMMVEPVKIIRSRSDIAGDGSTNHLVPLEFILRHFITGSLWDRLQDGRILAQDLGFEADACLEKGARLETPMFEITTKLEPIDRSVSRQEARHLSRMDDAALDGVHSLCVQIDALMDEQTKDANIIHVDGKKEFGFDKKGRLMIVDVFGTADEDRWWDRRRYEESGEMAELSKEAVRKYYRESGYHKALYDARDNNENEPDIPPLPEALLEEISALYRSIADQMCGK